MSKLSAQSKKHLVKLTKAFPNMPKSDEFMVILKERLEANNFTDEMVENAVNHIIETCAYPTISDFIMYKKGQSPYKPFKNEN